MDQERFDRIARALGAGATRRAGLRAALGGLLGTGIAAAALDADAARRRRHDANAGKKRRKTCKPACANGFECVKVGRKRECQCPSGVTCGDACCLVGQTCRDGRCVAEPEPGQCIAAGEPCKGVGRPCCDGRTCSSGQGGETDVACYVHKTGACQSTADCVYGTACIDGRCGFDVPPPAALGAPCNASVGQQCADPEAVCVAYDGPDAPSGEAGTYCTLPLNKVCTGDPDCTCYHCWYENPEVGGGTSRAGDPRTVSTRLACCGPAGYTCKTDRNCCIGALCVNGVCQSETTCDVCASGCPYASIADAYADTVNKPAGSTITIAPGTYTEASIALSRDITFRRCGDSGTVIWRNLDSGSQYLLTMPSSGEVASNVDLAFLEFTMTPGVEVDMLMSFSGASANQRLKVTALGCTWRDFVYPTGGYTAVDLGNWTDADFTDCTFRNLVLDSDGAAIRSSGDWRARTTVALTRSTFTDNSCDSGGAISLKSTDLTAVGSSFTGNTASGVGGAIYLNQSGCCWPNYKGSSATLHDCTLTDNRTAVANAGNGGGAIQVCANCTLSLTGTTSITGNTAAGYGSGIRAEVFVNQAHTYAPARISSAATATVAGNSATPDCQVWDADTWNSFGVSCFGWCVPSGGACQTGLTTCCNAGETCTGAGICG